MENNSILNRLLGQEVVIRQGVEGTESASYYTRTISKFGFDGKGNPTSIVLDGGSQAVPYLPNITTVSLIASKSN